MYKTIIYLSDHTKVFIKPLCKAIVQASSLPEKHPEPLQDRQERKGQFPRFPPIAGIVTFIGSTTADDINGLT